MVAYLGCGKMEQLRVRKKRKKKERKKESEGDGFSSSFLKDALGGGQMHDFNAKRSQKYGTATGSERHEAVRVVDVIFVCISRGVALSMVHANIIVDTSIILLCTSQSLRRYMQAEKQKETDRETTPCNLHVRR